MSPSVSPGALIHRARVIRDVPSGAKNAQGERTRTEDDGPWFPARYMPRQPPTEGDREGGGRKRSVKPSQLLWGDEDELGAALTFPTAGDVVEVERDAGGQLVTQRFEISGDPGVFDAGDGAFGGQAGLVEVTDAA